MSTSALGTTATIPRWASTLRVRFLGRAINAGATAVQIEWVSSTGYIGFAAAITAATIPAASGDSGWDWYDSGPIAVPPFASGARLFAGGPNPVDGTMPMLVALDAVAVIPGNASGEAAAATPACLMWLKDPLNPAGNVELVVEAQSDVVSSTSDEGMLILRPADRPDAVVLSDVVQDEVLSGLTFITTNDGQYAAFTALRASQRTLLLQLPFGDLVGEQHYVRLGPQLSIDRVVTQRQNVDGQNRRLQIDATEVAAP